jgi:hypothetical protein
MRRLHERTLFLFPEDGRVVRAIVGRYMTLPGNRGTILRYGRHFRRTLEDNGTGFRYLDLSGAQMIVNSGIAERFSFILQ